jgi:hypothetical protein
MKINGLNILILFCLCMANISCVHYYYAPSSNNVPLFKEKNEVRIQAQYSSDVSEGGLRGFEVQTAYAVSNHAAVQLNVYSAKQKDDGYGSGNGTYVEAAGGYYKPLFNNHCVFETYSGFGLGSVNNIYRVNSYRGLNEEAKTSVFKFFIQPSFGYSNHYFAAALSSKFSLVNFNVKSSTVSKENHGSDYNEIEFIRNGKSYVYWEPGVMIRAGCKNFQIISQATVTFGNEDKISTDRSNFAIGVIVPFKTSSQ